MIHYLGLITGIGFGLIGILGAAFLSYSANHRLTSMRQDNVGLKVAIDQVHILVNSQHEDVKQVNRNLQKTNDLLTAELATVKRQLADLIRLNATAKK